MDRISSAASRRGETAAFIEFARSLGAIALAGAGAASLFAATGLLLVRRRWRVVGLVLAATAVLALWPLASNGAQRGFGVALYVFAIGGVSTKQWFEITEDIDDRRAVELPDLVRSPGSVLRRSLDPTFWVVYRWRMLRDPYSRYRLLRQSWSLPERFARPRPPQLGEDDLARLRAESRGRHRARA